MGTALYRKYRSRALAEIVGQEHITTTLERAIKAGHISHAYLFTGPRGTGKTSIARILAHQINNLPYADTPHLDIIEIDAASNRRIDDIRDLREKVHIAPISATYKVYIIDEVHMLTGESFNALLKTLEEPPAHVVFILATTEVHKLPATIISRTQRFAFRPGVPDAVANHLKMIAKKEGISIDDSALSLIAEHGDGSFRDSLSLLDQLSHISTKKISADDVSATLGLAPKTQLETLSQAIINSDYQKIATILNQLEQRGSSPSAIVGQLNRNLAAQAINRPSLYVLIDNLLSVPQSYNPSLKLLTTLIRFTTEQPGTPKQDIKHAPALATAEPVITIAQKSIDKAASPAPKATALKQVSSDTIPLGKLSPQDWQNVLAATKANNPPLFAIVKSAMPVIENGGLALKFKFALHSKKLDDSKQKAALTSVLQQVLGISPLITVATDKTAVPPPVTADPQVASVAAIMGGGEIVNAETD